MGDRVRLRRPSIVCRTEYLVLRTPPVEPAAAPGGDVPRSSLLHYVPGIQNKALRTRAYVRGTKNEVRRTKYYVPESSRSTALSTLSRRCELKSSRSKHQLTGSGGGVARRPQTTRNHPL